MKKIFKFKDYIKENKNEYGLNLIKELSDKAKEMGLEAKSIESDYEWSVRITNPKNNYSIVVFAPDRPFGSEKNDYNSFDTWSYFLSNELQDGKVESMDSIIEVIKKYLL